MCVRCWEVQCIGDAPFWQCPGWWSSCPCWIILAHFCLVTGLLCAFCSRSTSELITYTSKIIFLCDCAINYAYLCFRRMVLGRGGELCYMNQLLMVAVLGWLFQVRCLTFSGAEKIKHQAENCCRWAPLMWPALFAIRQMHFWHRTMPFIILRNKVALFKIIIIPHCYIIIFSKVVTKCKWKI